MDPSASSCASLVVLAGASCGYDATPLPQDQPAVVDDAAPGTAPTCDATTATVSYAPDATSAQGASLQRIRDRGYLVAGVAADTYLLGSRNPFTGQIEGFDIDMVNAIAETIFGDEGSRRSCA